MIRSTHLPLARLQYGSHKARQVGGPTPSGKRSLWLDIVMKIFSKIFITLREVEPLKVHRAMTQSRETFIVFLSVRKSLIFLYISQV